MAYWDYACFWSLAKTVGKTPGEIFESIIEEFYKSYIHDGDTVIDAGYYRGRHTLPLAKVVGKTGSVIAIDANPRIPLLDLEALQNVDVISAALSDANGSASFFVALGAEAYSGLKKAENSKKLGHVEFEEIAVPTITLDSVAKIAKFLKLDLEGGELHAIEGGVNLICRSRPIIAFEFNRQYAAQLYHYTKEHFFETFRGLNYDLYDVFGRVITPQSWDRPLVPWYAFGVPHEQRFTSRLVRRCARRVLKNCTVNS